MSGPCSNRGSASCSSLRPQDSCCPCRGGWVLGKDTFRPDQISPGGMGLEFSDSSATGLPRPRGSLAASARVQAGALTKPRSRCGETIPEVSSSCLFHQLILVLMDLGGSWGSSLPASKVSLLLRREWNRHLGVQAEFCLWGPFVW